jgi:transposase
MTPFVLDGSINRNAFGIYVEKVLVPELAPGDIVVMDNLSSHKGPRARQMIDAAGASLVYLPPYSPDFNPIENASQSSRRSCAKPRRELSTASGAPLDKPSTPSRPPNARTSSPQQAMMQCDRLTL